MNPKHPSRAKNLLLLLLLFSILFCAPCCAKKNTEAPTPSSPQDEEEFEIVLSSAQGRRGEDVLFTLSLKNNPTIAGYSVTVCYDPAVLTFKGCENKVEGGFAITNSTVKGKVRVMCTVMGGNALDHEGISDELTFTVKEDAPAGESALQVILADDADSVYRTENNEMPAVACVLRGGTFTVN